MPTNAEVTKILTELYTYNPSAIVELFILDLNPLAKYYASKGAPISPQKYYFHNGVNQKIQGSPGAINLDVRWGSPEQIYIARSIQVDGFSYSSAGETARPTMTVSNHDLFFTELCRAYANLVGAKITRIRTFVKFLNSSNFLVTNPTADPNAKFPDDVYFIDRVSEEIPGQMTFELAPSWDVEGLLLPRRQVVANYCYWEYKKDPCNWTVNGVSTFGTITGTSAAASVGTYYGRQTTTNSTTGSGAKLKVIINSNSTAYSTGATITVANPGTEYTVGNTLTVSGADLGGATPANDLTVTITAVTGGTFYDQNDLIVSSASQDACGKRYNSCKLRFGTRALPFGGFPSAGLYGKPI